MLGSIYCQNDDTLGPVELIVWTEQSNQGEVSIIIFGMSK